MKKTTALSFSSLLLLGGVSYLAAKLADLDLTFFFHGDDDQHALLLRLNFTASLPSILHYS